MKPKELKEQFLHYRKLGFRPFPVLCYRQYSDSKGWERKKKPMISEWKPFRTRQPSIEEINKWCAHPYALWYGIGISTDGLVVLDFDHKDGKPNLTQFVEDIPMDSTMWTRTGSGGVHMFFLNNGEEIRNSVNIFDKDKELGDTIVDIRAEGGYVVVGESELWSEDPTSCVALERLTVSAVYEAHNLMHFSEIPALPSIIREALLTTRGTGKEAKYKDIKTLGKITTGGRNETATSLAFRLMITVKNAKDYEVNRRTYWDIIKKRWENWKADEKEYESAWKSALLKIRQRKGKNFPDESNEVIARTKGKIKEDIQFNEDLGEWGFDIKSVLRIGEIFKYHLVDGMTFEVNADDFYSQTRFRTAYTYGTNKILPAIKAKSFEKFLGQLRPIDLLDSGTSLRDIVRDVLIAQVERISPSDTLDEAMAYISAASWAVYGKRIYFHPHSILQSHSYLSKKANISKIVSALQDIGAKQDKIGAIGYWYYDVA